MLRGCFSSITLDIATDSPKARIILNKIIAFLCAFLTHKSQHFNELRDVLFWVYFFHHVGRYSIKFSKFTKQRRRVFTLIHSYYMMVCWYLRGLLMKRKTIGIWNLVHTLHLTIPKNFFCYFPHQYRSVVVLCIKFKLILVEILISGPEMI